MNFSRKLEYIEDGLRNIPGIIFKESLRVGEDNEVFAFVFIFILEEENRIRWEYEVAYNVIKRIVDHRIILDNICRQDGYKKLIKVRDQIWRNKSELQRMRSIQKSVPRVSDMD